MSTLLDDLMNVDFSYPGFSFGLESWAFMAYIETVPDQIAHAQEKYVAAGRERLEREKDDLLREEMAAEFNEILEAAEVHIPRFVRGGAIVASWGLFESFSKKCMQYVERREAAAISFSEVRAKSYCQSVEKFLASVRVSHVVQWTPEQRQALIDLEQLRNVLAHCNGYLMDLPQERVKTFEALTNRLVGVEIDGSAIRVSQDFVVEAATLATEMASMLVQGIATHYDGPAVPKAPAAP